MKRYLQRMEQLNLKIKKMAGKADLQADLEKATLTSTTLKRLRKKQIGVHDMSPHIEILIKIHTAWLLCQNH